MNEWLVIAVCYTEIPGVIKDIVDDASDTAAYVGITDKLGLAEIIDGDESYYVIKKDDFEEWFGD